MEKHLQESLVPQQQVAKGSGREQARWPEERRALTMATEVLGRRGKKERDRARRSVVGITA